METILKLSLNFDACHDWGSTSYYADVVLKNGAFCIDGWCGGGKNGTWDKEDGEMLDRYFDSLAEKALAKLNKLPLLSVMNEKDGGYVVLTEKKLKFYSFCVSLIVDCE